MLICKFCSRYSLNCERDTKNCDFWYLEFSAPMYATKENLNKLPKENGVYIYIENDKAIYIGSSRNIWDRNYKHHRIGNNSDFANALKLDGRDINLDKFKIQYKVLDIGRAEFEEFLIEYFNPKYNNFKRKKKNQNYDNCINNEYLIDESNPDLERPLSYNYCYVKKGSVSNKDCQSCAKYKEEYD